VNEMEIALDCGAIVIGVNNRNLHNFQLGIIIYLLNNYNFDDNNDDDYITYGCVFNADYYDYANLDHFQSSS